MGKAIAGGALKNNAIAAGEIYVRNSSDSSTQSAAIELGVNACGSLKELLSIADVVILGVKPHMIADLLHEITDLGTEVDNILFISIAAGVSIAAMEDALLAGARIIRTMPNTPTLVGEGVIAYTLNDHCGDSDEQIITQLLQNSAKLTRIPEKLMNPITGLSGSGPAYVYMFIEALADGAVLEGLPRAQALKLASQTVLGSAKMVIETGEHPATLRDRVASPGGTTIAGITALEENGFRNATIKAVQAATQRSKELS